MSKSQGTKIGIKFTEPLTGDPSGISPTPLSQKWIMPQGIATTSNSYSATYTPDKAFDNDLSTHWQTRNAAPQWIKIEINEAIRIKGFRWYTSSYNPNVFILEGSNNDNDADWTQLYAGTSVNASGWKEFIFDSWTLSYKYLKWTINSLHSSRLYIYEIELLVPVGQELAFTLTGKELQWVDGLDNNGPLIDTNYEIAKVVRYLIPIIWKGNFNNGILNNTEVNQGALILKQEED